MRLREIAYSRSGDKGTTSNICVFTYEDSDYEFLRSNLTTQLVAAKFMPLISGQVVRYELPNVCGLNFVLYDALDGGVSMTLRTDPHGKSFQSYFLDIDLPDRDQRETRAE